MQGKSRPFDPDLFTVIGLGICPLRDKEVEAVS
jgi:hypothetical protein